MRNYLSTHKKYIDFFKHSNCPDEEFFHTLFMNSPYKNQREDSLHYIDMAGCKNSPRILTVADIDKLKCSNKLMGRKFDIGVDYEIIQTLNSLFQTSDLRS